MHRNICGPQNDTVLHVTQETFRQIKQITVIWHVDDSMIYCEEKFELSKFSCYLANIYGPKLAMHLGNKHDYLGMDFEFMDNGSL